MKTDNFTIVKDSLHRFIVSNYYDEMSIDSALKDYRIDKFFIPFNEELFSYQISIYNVYKMELMKISKELETYNLKFLVLKGIILADDLYEPYYLRRSMDLDILVEFKDIDIVDNILRVLGYFPINEDFYTNSIKHVKSNKSIREEITHITPYKKIIDDNITSIIELHINFAHYLHTNLLPEPKSIFSLSRDVYIKSLDLKLYTLSIEDTFIHLCAHLLRHFYWDFFRFLRGKNHFEFKMDLLFEVALFFNKYKKYLSGDNLIIRAFQLNQIEPVLFVLNMMDNVFDIMNINQLLKKCQETYENNTFHNDLSTDIVRILLSINNNDICTKICHELTEIIMQELKKSKEILYIFENKKNIKELGKHYYNLNLTEIFDYKKDCQNKHLTSKGFYSITYNIKELIITFEIYNLGYNLSTHKICIALEKDENCSFFKDYKKTDYTDKRFSKNQQVIYITCIDNYHQVSMNGDYLDNIKFNEKMYNEKIVCSVLIPWSVIDIMPIKGRVVDIVAFIEFEINENEARYYRFQIKKSKDDYYSLYYPWSSDSCRFKLM